MRLKSQKTEAPVVEVLEQENGWNPSEAWANKDDQGPNETSNIKTLLRPLHISMAIFGLYNFNHINAGNTTSTRKCSLSFVYRLLLFTMLVLFLVKMAVSLFYLPKETIQYNGLFAWWLLVCLLWFVIFWRATSHKSGKLLSAFSKWRDTVLPKFHELNLEYPSKAVLKTVIKLLVISICMTFFNIFGCGIQFALPVDVELYTSPFQTNGFTIAAFNVFQLLASAVWIIPSAYVAAVTVVVQHAFVTLNKGLCNAIKTESCKIPPDIQKFRVLHAHLCSLVSEFDSDLSLFYGSLCVSHVGQACFTLYRIIHKDMVTFQLIMYSFWMIASLAMIAFGTIFAARVNDELCGLVADLDQDLKLYYANSFVWKMLLSLVCLYTLLKSDLNLAGQIANMYFFILSIGFMLAIFIAAAMVNEAAHAPLDTIYYINVGDITMEKLAQINLFLSKLTGTQVGFSTCGLLIITKEFILTIAGVFLTYFAVLYTL